MKPIGQQDFKSWRQRKKGFSNWMKPPDMKKESELFMKQVELKNLFSKPGIDYITEAYAAALFCEIVFPESKVRLILAERPDFEIALDEQTTRSFEFSEVDDPRRRRGDEYQTFDEESDEIFAELESINDKFRSIPEWIDAGINRKIRKAQKLELQNTPYPKNTELLLYVNIATYGFKNILKKSEIISLTSPAAKYFTAVWLLVDYNVIKSWPDWKVWPKTASKRFEG